MSFTVKCINCSDVSDPRMSSDVYSKPDSVRFNKKTEEKSEWEEEEVCIYKSADDVINNQTTFQLQDEEQKSQDQPEGKKKPKRVSKVCKIVLLVLFIAATGAIAMAIYSTVGKLTDFSGLNEVKANTSRLLNQLVERRKLMEKKYEEMLCPNGWKFFGPSCYFKSTEKKTWTDSRKDCQDRGADLVIINSRDEQKFVEHLNQNGDSWIGLEVAYVWWRCSYRWRWVDGSLLTQMFWGAERPRFSSSWYMGYCSDQGMWKDSYYSSEFNWICEKPF